MWQKLKIAVSFDQVALPSLPIKPCWLLSNNQSLIYPCLSQVRHLSECAVCFYTTHAKIELTKDEHLTVNGTIWFSTEVWYYEGVVNNQQQKIEETHSDQIPLEANLFSLSLSDVTICSHPLNVQSLYPIWTCLPLKNDTTNQCSSHLHHQCIIIHRSLLWPFFIYLLK